MPASSRIHYGSIHGSAVAQYIAAELQPFARRHDRDAVPADVTTQENSIARPHALRPYNRVVLDHAYTRCIDEDAITFAPVHHLGVTRDHLHAGLIRRPAHGLHHAPQRFHRQSLFKDEARTQIERPRSAHGQVVHRAVHGQRAYVSSREERAGARRASR